MAPNAGGCDNPDEDERRTRSQRSAVPRTPVAGGSMVGADAVAVEVSVERVGARIGSS